MRVSTGMPWVLLLDDADMIDYKSDKKGAILNYCIEQKIKKNCWNIL